MNDDLVPSRESARGEAQSLFRLLGRDGNTVESLRDVIAVPPKIESALREYASSNLADAHWIEGVLRFRELVGKEFEKLVAAGATETNDKTSPVTQAQEWAIVARAGVCESGPTPAWVDR